MPVDLALARNQLIPSTFFLEQANQCEKLGIASQDCYGDFTASKDTSWLRKFETEVSEHLLMEDSLFAPSGVMSQSMMLKAVQHLSKSAATQFICHYSSHLLLHEKNNYSRLLNLTPIVIPSQSSVFHQDPVSFDNIKSILDSSDPQSIVALILEVPHREIGGKCTSWEDLVSISEVCRQRGIHLHMDGARLWEASAHYEAQGHSLHNLCSLFDSVYVSFYKGLGGVTGAMLLGSTALISECRDWLRMFGGNLFAQLPLAVSCWAGFRENKDSFALRRARMQEVVSLVSRQIRQLEPTEEAEGDKEGKPLIWFDPPVPQVSLIHVYFRVECSVLMAAQARATQACGVSCILRSRPAPHNPLHSYTEFNMGPLNLPIPDEDWTRGYSALWTELKAMDTPSLPPSPHEE